MGCVFPDGSVYSVYSASELPSTQVDYLPSGGFCLRVASSHSVVDVVGASPCSCMLC